MYFLFMYFLLNYIMTHIITPDEEEGMDKINIDELFEKNHSKDLRQLSLFKKILNRIHRRINTTSNLKKRSMFGSQCLNLFLVSLYMIKEIV